MKNKCVDGPKIAIVPGWIFASGIWAELTGAAKAVLGVIALHADKGGMAFPGIEQLMALSGLKRRAVQKAIGELTRRGVMLAKTGGGRKLGGGYTHSVYTILRNPAGDSANGALECAANPEASGERRILEQVAAHGEVIEQRTPVRPNIPDNIPATGKTGAADDVRDELARNGISAPKLSSLASMPGLTVGMVRDLAARIGKAANPAGLLVTLIEREGLLLVEAARRKAAALERREAAAQQNRAAEAAARAEQEAAQTRRQALIAQMADEELSQYVEHAIAKCQSSAKWWRRDIKTHGTREAVLRSRPLQIAVCMSMSADEDEHAPAQTTTNNSNYSITMAGADACGQGACRG